MNEDPSSNPGDAEPSDSNGNQVPPSGEHSQQPPPPYGYGQQPPLPGEYGQQPAPPYGYGPQTPPPYGYGPQTTPFGYADPANQWAAYYPSPTDPLVSADFGGWWNRSFGLLKAAWRPLVGVQLVSVLPIAAVAIVVGLIVGRSPGNLTNTTAADGQVDFHALLKLFLATSPLLVTTFVVSLVVPLALIHVVVRTATGQPVSVARALLAGLRRVLPMLGWLLLSGLLELLGLLFCFLPGLYAIAALAVLPVIVLLEPGQGIGRSFQLFHADVGASLGRLLTMFGLSLVGTVANLTLSAIVQAGSSFGPAAIGAVLSALISGAISLATGVVLAPMYVTTYADMRSRREPFSTAYLATV